MQKMEISIRKDMQAMETSIRGDMQKMEASIRNDIRKTLFQLGTLMVTLASILAALQKMGVL